MTGNRSSNRLINSLSDHDYDLISTGLEEVDLPQGFHLATAGQSFNHVYFPCNGIASVIAVSPKGRRAEAGMVGREGFTPIGGLVRPSEGPFDIVIQVAGHGLRLKLPALHGLVDSSPALRDLCFVISWRSTIKLLLPHFPMHPIRSMFGWRDGY